MKNEANFLRRITLVRHGETLGNRKMLMLGQDDSELSQLTATGKKMAKDVSGLVKDYQFDQLICSPLTRTRDTAKIILNGTKLKTSYDDRLLELNFGNENGMSISDYMAKHQLDKKDWWLKTMNKPFEGGESILDLLKRVSGFTNDLLEKNWHHVLIVSHANPLKMFLACLTGLSPEEAIMLRLKPCTAFDFGMDEDGKWQVEQIYPIDSQE